MSKYIVKEHAYKQIRTPSGAWSKSQYDVKDRYISAEEYEVATNKDTCAWFNARVTRAYFEAGYLVDKYTAMSPSKEYRIVSEYKPILLRNIGNRERWILQNLGHVEESQDGKTVTLFANADIDGYVNTCMYDLQNKCFCN